MKAPFVLRRPVGGAAALPLVCDSPHGGTDYPDDFGHAIGRAALRRCEDTHVDALWAGVPAAGGTLLCATFPRSYIDPNRAETDVDAGALDGDWEGEAAPSRHCLALGNGLVWTKTPEHREIYARRLTAAEVRGRIARCWRPYREALAAELAAAAARHGGWWHLDLHSMPSNVYERLGLPPRPAADVVLGDRGGTTCSAGFVQVVRAAFEAEGLRVALNDPYPGLELVRFASDPGRGRHSLQVELNRALYMDESTREPHAGYRDLQRAVDAVIRQVADFVADRSRALARECAPATSGRRTPGQEPARPKVAGS